MTRQLNLMPNAAFRRQAVAQAIAFWSRVLLAALIVCGALVASQAWSSQEAKQVRDALEAQHEPVKQLRSDIRLLSARVAGLTSEKKLALELATNQPMVTLLGELGDATAYAGGELFVESLSFERRPSTTEAPAAQALQIQGAGRDNLSVTRFAEHLRSSGLFQEVQLTSTASRVLASQSMTAFEMECVF